MSVEKLKRRDWRVLELRSDDCALVTKSFQRIGVVVFCDEVYVGDLARRGVRVGFQHHCAIPHHAGGDQRVATELATTQHANRGGREDRHVGQPGHSGGSVAAADRSRFSSR